MARRRRRHKQCGVLYSPASSQRAHFPIKVRLRLEGNPFLSAASALSYPPPARNFEEIHNVAVGKSGNKCRRGGMRAGKMRPLLPAGEGAICHCGTLPPPSVFMGSAPLVSGTPLVITIIFITLSLLQYPYI